jgi:cytidylate kinase
MAPPRQVIISGFTAAGKTTHARHLAASLGWRYVGMSEIRRSCVPDSSTEREEWHPTGDRRRAADESLDLDMDRRLAERIRSIDVPTVVDAWLQPWLSELSGVTRVWLESDFESRVLKAQVSRMRAGLAAMPSIRDTVAAKDEFSVTHFRRLYGVDFGPDPEVFDLLLDNSGYLTEATIGSSDAGISRFAAVFNSRVRALVEARSYVG